MPIAMKTFGLRPGRRIGRSYEVEWLIGGGSEGEVYQVCDRATGIQRAAKLFFPHRDPRSRISVRHAQKLDRLRHCPIVLHYHHSEMVKIGSHQTIAVISELCEGEPLQRWIDRHRGGRVSAFVALTVLTHLAHGLEMVHDQGEYHADVHTENILIRSVGTGFELKLIDFYEWGRPTKAKMQQDILGAVRVLYDMLGGKKHYASFVPEAKYICAALRTDRILKRFPSISVLRHYLETFEPETVF